MYGTTPSGGSIPCQPCSQGTFFSVNTGDVPFVNLEPTQKTGNVGAKVGMFGQGFSSQSVVKFGGVAATSVTRSGTTYITAVVSRRSPHGSSYGDHGDDYAHESADVQGEAENYELYAVERSSRNLGDDRRHRADSDECSEIWHSESDHIHGEI